MLLDGDKSRLESRIAHRPEASAGRACPLRVFYREPIDHPARGLDDHANAAALALVLAEEDGQMVAFDPLGVVSFG